MGRKGDPVTLLVGGGSDGSRKDARGKVSAVIVRNRGVGNNRPGSLTAVYKKRERGSPREVQANHHSDRCSVALIRPEIGGSASHYSWLSE